MSKTQKIDLHTILTSYADKINSPVIDPPAFVSYLEKYARKNVQENPTWLAWTENTEVKFRLELANLAEEEKCILLHDTPNGQIYMPNFYHKLLEKYYNNIENNMDVPFPNEASLKSVIPENQIQSLGSGSELDAFLDDQYADLSFNAFIKDPDNETDNPKNNDSSSGGDDGDSLKNTEDDSNQTIFDDSSKNNDDGDSGIGTDDDSDKDFALKGADDDSELKGAGDGSLDEIIINLKKAVKNSNGSDKLKGENKNAHVSMKPTGVPIAILLILSIFSLLIFKRRY